jgi:hypothetical protein
MCINILKPHNISFSFKKAKKEGGVSRSDLGCGCVK